MKAGVNMRRRSNMETSSMIVLLTIISIVVQFAAYYFLALPYLILGISSAAVIVCIHILLEQSLSYEPCTAYTILLLFISSIITVLSYPKAESNIFPYTNTMLGIIAVNWAVPMLYCFIRNMFDYGNRIERFNSFYRNISLVFIVFYIVFLLYGSFSTGSIAALNRIRSYHQNFTPFWWIATLIEDYLNDMIPLSDILAYLFGRIMIFIPYGFYIILVFRYRSKLIRFISLLLLPLLIELIQYFIIPARCDVDDLIYAFIGGILGGLLYYLTNAIYRAFSNKDFLSKDSEYKYSSGSLHF